MSWWPLRAEFQIVGQALQLLESWERRRLWALVPLVLLVAVFEVAGVASIAPFIALLTDPSVVKRNPTLRYIYSTGGFESTEQLFLGVGLAILVLLVFSNATSAMAMWALTRFSGFRNASLSTRVLRGYLNRPYPFFLERNSTELVRKALIEVQHVVIGVIGQMTTLLARAVAVLFICATLFALNPPLALTAIPIFGGAYGFLYMVSRRFSSRAGEERNAAEKRRFRIAGEALAGVKEVKLYRLEERVVEAFRGYSTTAAVHTANNAIVSQLPRYALETVAFGGVLAIVLYELRYGKQLSAALPVIGLYAFAAVRLLPALQAAFASLNVLRFHASSVTSLRKEVIGAQLDRQPPTEEPSLSFQTSVELSKIDFSYSASSRAILQDLQLRLERGEWLAIVGPTGSGKSTLIDLMLGLLEPTSGAMLVDGEPVHGRLLRAWQARTAYVPQQVFLIDDTIEANICFGVSPDSVDQTRIETAAKTAQIHEFIERELPLGYRTVVGDRGIRLSGGQRQRLGIARALYRQPDFLVLDEATSALDSATEDAFFDALHRELSTCTVVSVTHRVSTTRLFDRVYRLEAGQLLSVPVLPSTSGSEAAQA